MVNRYETYGEIASGGMATVEYGRLLGPHNFSRPVAIKRLHAHFAKDPAFAAMFIDEARLSARLLHANIVPTLDVIQAPGEIALVMEYVHGEALSSLLQRLSERAELVPVQVATALVASVLHGLHAAHEARNERDELLGVVHRDVSPHNVMVGVDGIVRVLDFGIAKAIDQARTTPSGEIKGKLAYIAPEQWRGELVDRRADVFGAAAVLWETLTGFTLFDAENASVMVRRVLDEPIVPPSAHVHDIPQALDAIVMRGLARDPAQRYSTAREMALELEHKLGIATQSELSDWLQQLAGSELNARAVRLRRLQEHGGVALFGRAPAALGERDARALESVPPSVETQSRASELRSEKWPWIAGGSLAIIGTVMFLLTQLSNDSHEPVSRHALAPLAVPALLSLEPRETTKPDLPAPTAASTEASPDGTAQPRETPGSRKSRNTGRSQAKRSVAGSSDKTADDTNAVKRAPIAEPQCSPVMYVDGIRRINPDCPEAHRPNQ